MKETRFYLKILWQMIKADLLVFRSIALGQIIDMLGWFVILILVFTYIMPLLGLTYGFGEFIAISSIVSCSFWSVWGYSIQVIADIEGNQEIMYFMTLPLPNWVILLKQIISWTIQSTVKTLPMLPIAKLLLMDRMNLSQISILKLVPIYILINIFTSSFTLFMASLVRSIKHVEQVSNRFLFPMWFLGCSQFSWQVVFKEMPAMAYGLLANPLCFANEGLHAAILGPNNFLSFYLCIIAMAIFTVIFYLSGTYKLKKRLDYV